MSETTKTCSKCGETKLLSEFYKSKKERLGVMSHCKQCDKKKGKAYYDANSDKVNARTKATKMADPEKTKAQNRNWYENNKESNNERGKKWRQKNPEKSRQFSKNWELKNPDASRERNRRRLKTAIGRLENCIRAGFHKGIRTGGKQGRKTFDLLGYTSSDLKDHIEKQFLPGMTWSNHGRGENCWHIDHIIPLSAHNYETPDDIDFKKAWELSNLRPLWEKDNLTKSNKLLKPFQPSLLLAPANDNKPADSRNQDVERS